jgi:hypothetical protein
MEGYTDSVTKQVNQNTNNTTTSKNSQDASGNIQYNPAINDASGNIQQKNSTNTTSVDASGNMPMSIDLSSLWNKSNLILIVWFLAIYLVAYFVLGYFFNKGDTAGTFQTALGRMLDFIIIGVVIIIIFSSYYSTTESDRQKMMSDFSTKTEHYINDPFALLFTGLFILLLYVVIYLFRVPMTSEAKPISINIIETIAWLFFVFLIFVNFFKYVLGISITDMFDRVWGKDLSVKDISGNAHKESDVSGNTVLAKNDKQVFNVSNNLYTYDDAQAVCKAYGADLASYDQIEQAYNDGAEWCNYGWSEGQMIYFPTQKATWQNLQKDPKRKNNCGRPGINGGYMANPYIKFGVNCFGKKPDPTAADLARMKTSQTTPKTPEDLALEAKVDFWKNNADKMLQLSSFNKNKWSEY